ncbi:MAG: MFS transporter [Armatimonadota bacterium]
MIFTRFAPKESQYAYRWDARAAWLAGLFAGMSVPFFGVIARRMHASAFEIALLISAPFLGHLLSMVVAWHMQNRPKKPYVFWLGTIARGSLLFMAFAHTPPVFIGIIIFSQLVGCFTAPAYASIMKDAYPDHCRGRLMGMVRIGMTTAAMIGGLSTGRLLDHGLPMTWILLLAGGAALLIAHELQRNLWRVVVAAGIVGVALLSVPLLRQPISYQIIFPIAGVLGVLSLWMFNHLPEGKVTADPEKRFNVLEGLATLVTDRRFGLYSLGFFIFGFGNLLQSPLIPLFQVDELRISNQWVGILVLVNSGASAIFYAIWGRLLDRYSPFLTVIASFAIWGLSPFVYANAHHVPELLVASVLTGIAMPGIDLTWLNAVLHFTEREHIARYAALHTFLVGIRGLLAPFVGTWLYGMFNLRQCFYISAAVIWAGTLFMLAVVWLVILPHQRAKARAQHEVMPPKEEGVELSPKI